MTLENEDKKVKQRETASRPTVRIKPSHTEPSEIEGEAEFLRAAAATERKPERKEDFEDVGPGFRVTPLLQAILDLRQGRAEEEYARRRRRTEAYNAASAAVAAGWLEERAERRLEQRAAQRAADLHGERMAAFRAGRMARRRDEGYTMAVFAEEMEEVVAEVGGRGRLEGETDGGWYRRLREVEDEAWRVFNGNREVLTRGFGRPEAGDDEMLDADSWDVEGEGEDEDGRGKRRERRRAEVEELLARKRGFVWGSLGWEERGGWALPRPETGEWPWDKRR
ncbi:hypothetical protein N3K66_008217 [Trichothecium roseum]|uniref:Uncharacterized protein n=1 Tax=Trichothecium roseum TaxID=47278 RepID=A0ACC0UTZ3_9HYPO|nr:hypothetical protein N3K66_008217 [Trichothecium roseum]